MFCVGDRVRCVVDYPDGNEGLVIGSTGTVINPGLEGTEIYVRWDDKLEKYDRFSGVEDGYIWYVNYEQIESICDDEDENEPEYSDDMLTELLFGGEQK